MNILKILVSFGLALLLFTGCDSDVKSDKKANLNTKLDTLSYSLGFIYGDNLSNEGVEEIDFNNFIAGFEQALNNQESEVTNFEMQMALQIFQQELEEQQAARREAESQANIATSIEFLEENAAKDDVQVTDSGLQYRVIEEGSGARPSAESEVEVHYRGTLIDGREFDSSYERGQTATFPLNRVIPGWTEGLQLMREGAKYEFFIPSELAYGINPPRGSIIEPGAVLVFEVELIDIKD
ncbi:MAG: FKBP-type peptidyl-prolyl cis-trans isomerase [Balneolaceae bacterium]